MKSLVGLISLALLAASCGGGSDVLFDDSGLPGGGAPSGGNASGGKGSAGSQQTAGTDAGGMSQGGTGSAGMSGGGTGGSGGGGGSGGVGEAGSDGSGGESGEGGEGGSGPGPEQPDAIYVATSGVDSAECGLTSGSACKTISRGVARSVQATKSAVYVQAGDYPELLVLKAGVRVLGGFDAQWHPGDRTEPGHRVAVRGAQEPTSQEYVAVWAHDLSALASLENLVIVGPDAQGHAAGSKDGRSSYAVHAVSAELSFKNVDIIAGKGARGADGDAGQDAATVEATDGMHGGVGKDGAPNSIQIMCSEETSEGGPAGKNACADSPSDTETKGGPGGLGGARDALCTGWQGNWSYIAQAGGDGGDALRVLGDAGKGGARGSGGGPVSPASPAACGPTGSGNDGAIENGSGGKANSGGKLSGNFWYALSGGSGGTGKNGGGGGGGGGSGGCDSLQKTSDSRGAGGGGGGAGGCAARAGGGGGGGGGASFGIFALGSKVEVTGVSVVRGSGGDAGSGGKGGQGQSGGLGRDGGLHPGTATPGKGGNGGHGGHGGGGAGGAGGISYGALLGGGSSLKGTLVVSAGAGGKGGAGGVSAPSAPEPERDGNAGEPGTDGALGEQLEL